MKKRSKEKCPGCRIYRIKIYENEAAVTMKCNVCGWSRVELK